MERYIKWGIESDKLVMIDNGQPAVQKLPKRELSDDQDRCVFTYIGQINPFKGLDVLLDALGYFR
jgi:glycosyltransferase involved in cell wall biosynthesis